MLPARVVRAVSNDRSRASICCCRSSSPESTGTSRRIHGLQWRGGHDRAHLFDHRRSLRKRRGLFAGIRRRRRPWRQPAPLHDPAADFLLDAARALRLLGVIRRGAGVRRLRRAGPFQFLQDRHDRDGDRKKHLQMIEQPSPWKEVYRSAGRRRIRGKSARLASRPVYFFPLSGAAMDAAHVGVGLDVLACR